MVRGAYKKEDTKVCYFCCNKIFLNKDQFVLVGTYNRISKPDDQQFFHFSCWVEYFNKCVLNKARANIQFMQGKAMELLNNPVLRNALSQIKGSDNLIQMVATPLTEEVDEKTLKIKELKLKIQDATRNKKGRKPKK